MKPFDAILDDFAATRVLVVGDIMVDRFVYGGVSRISPEAPAPVIRADRSDDVAGGAGNVARTVAALGAACDIVGVVGSDDGASIVAVVLGRIPRIHAELVRVPGRQTTVKTRFVAYMHNTHLLRVDWEDATALPEAAETSLLEVVAARIGACDVVILSDYAKGVVTARVAAEVIALARRAGKPVVVDPKGQDYARYAGATAITPNVAELAQAVGRPVDNEPGALVEAARSLLEGTGCEAILVTRSERGVLAVHRDGTTAQFDATARRVVDVSGAGDTLAAGFALALACGASLANAAHLANSASGIVVAKQGTAEVTAEELRGVMLSRPAFSIQSKMFPDLQPLLRAVDEWRRDGLSVGFTNGCFDLLHPGHIELLRKARSLCDRLIVGLNSDASVKRLKGDSRPIQNEAARGTLMAALSFIDGVVVFGEDTPLRLISAILPDVLIKGADYRIDQVVGREVVEQNGGRVALVTVVPDSSTTGIIERVQAAGATGGPKLAKAG